MNLKHLTTTLILCAALFLQSCASLSDDAFAHAVKAGNHRETMRLMQPHSGKLRIQEMNGKWYNPLQYSIASGDKEASFALLERGAPTQFDGKSLAYNAARVNRPELASSFADTGYGSHSDISRAQADSRAERQANSRANAAALAMGVVFLAALMGGGSSRSGGGSCRVCGGDGIMHEAYGGATCSSCGGSGVDQY
ncbi:hypothetical protein ACFSSA_09225 [Luteolibacter algae]|uniref:Ankyrin repeat domain-containing protein n=1 Tax=Luteolibacter algae TaxID=454151 RepID=A0ABW5D7Y6_9BACT